MNSYYLGPKGTYSHQLLTQFFDQKEVGIPVQNFQEVVSHVQKEPDAIGLLAIENSISSSVHQTVDLLYNTSVCIVGEAMMNVSIDLLGIPGSSLNDITDVYSHPQALAQCSNVITNKSLNTHEMNSTSEAAAFVSSAKDPTKAALASSSCAEEHQLVVLEKDIANVQNNMTRWVFIAQPGVAMLGKKVNKLSYIFKVKHEPGSLVYVLDKIAQAKGNLTKIESRPLPGSHWEYGFWIDIEIPDGSQTQFDALMKDATLECRLVGAYEKGILYQS